MNSFLKSMKLGPLLFALLASCGLVLELLLLSSWSHAAAEREVRVNQEKKRLQQDIRSLADVEKRLEHAKRVAAHFRKELLSDESKNQLQSGWRDGWLWEEENRLETSDFDKVSYRLDKDRLPMSDWPALAETIEKHSTTPGMSLLSVSVEAAGGASHRTFNRVSMRVALFCRHDESSSAGGTR